MTASAPSKLVTFRIGDDLYAADVTLVERVLRYTGATSIPDVPDWLVGVVPYQGRAIPVIDLRLRFGLAPRADDAPARVLVFAAGGELVGAVVDVVLDVVGYDASQLAPPPALFHGLAGEYLRGLLHRASDVIVVLDATRILTTTERLAVARAIADPQPTDA